MRDIVPNWRPLTALVYAAEWNAFGLNAMAWRSVNLALHLSSVGVMYVLVARVTKRPAAGAIAALIFGVSGAHFDTVTYITALPHVMATLFMLSSLLAIITYAQDGERNAGAFWLAFGLFALGFLSNEGAFVYAPVIVGAYALFARRWQRAPLRLVLHAAPFVALAAGWLSFYESCSLRAAQVRWLLLGKPRAHELRRVRCRGSRTRRAASRSTPDAVRWMIAGMLAAVVARLRRPRPAHSRASPCSAWCSRCCRSRR